MQARSFTFCKLCKTLVCSDAVKVLDSVSTFSPMTQTQRHCSSTSVSPTSGVHSQSRNDSATAKSSLTITNHVRRKSFSTSASHFQPCLLETQLRLGQKMSPKWGTPPRRRLSTTSISRASSVKSSVKSRPSLSSGPGSSVTPPASPTPSLRSRLSASALRAASVQSQPSLEEEEEGGVDGAGAGRPLPGDKKRLATLPCTPAVYQPQRLAELSGTARLYHRILETVPDGIEMVFAYGSGVYQQEGHFDINQNMLDFIFVVDDPATWHRENMRRNSHHYSFLKYSGSRSVAYLQDEFGAGVYFNTLVRFEDRFLKYGVITTERLITDLLDWDTLYVSGRLHKPVRLVVVPRNNELMAAMQMNLHNALHAALLLLPETFCEESLYNTLAGLSYTGDFRMTFGEDRNKVSNIVRPNMIHFRRLYESVIQGDEHVYWHRNQGRLEQDNSYISRYHHLQLLPKTVLLILQEMRTKPGSHPDLEEVLQVYANDSHCDAAVIAAVTNIVNRSSWSQSLKTVLSAGMHKSLVYSLRKLLKMMRSKHTRKEDL